MNAIEVHDLHKSYDDFEAVRGIDFSVPSGQVFAFLGPNGAGKTTTVEILEGFRDRTSGDVRVLGHDPARGGRSLRDRIGIVLQECGFPRYATVKELLTLQAGYYSRSRSVNEVIELVELADKSDAVIRTLSGGQQRRLDLALALIGDPDLIFLDEPTTGFDPNARHSAWEVVRNLRTLGKTIFLTTHYMDEAQELADHVAVISGGRIVAEGPPHAIGGRDRAATVVRFAAGPDFSIDALPELDGEVSVIDGDVVTSTEHPTETLRRLTSWALHHGRELDNITVSKPTLEDVYLQLTKNDDSPARMSTKQETPA